MTSPEHTWKLIGDEWEETFATQTDLIDSHLVWEADKALFKDADETADCAYLWMHFNGTDHVPPLFQEAIEEACYQNDLAASLGLRECAA